MGVREDRVSKIQRIIKNSGSVTIKDLAEKIFRVENDNKKGSGSGSG